MNSSDYLICNHIYVNKIYLCRETRIKAAIEALNNNKKYPN